MCKSFLQEVLMIREEWSARKFQRDAWLERVELSVFSGMCNFVLEHWAFGRGVTEREESVQAVQ